MECKYSSFHIVKKFYPNQLDWFFYSLLDLNFNRSHGEAWRSFRSKVQRPILQLSTVRGYLEPLEQITDDFLQRCTDQLLDANSELPEDFDNEIHKWSLECKFQSSKEKNTLSHPTHST